jgi:hypothetical protein
MRYNSENPRYIAYRVTSKGEYFEVGRTNQKEVAWQCASDHAKEGDSISLYDRGANSGRGGMIHDMNFIKGREGRYFIVQEVPFPSVYPRNYDDHYRGVPVNYVDMVETYQEAMNWLERNQNTFNEYFEVPFREIPPPMRGWFGMHATKRSEERRQQQYIYDDYEQERQEMIQNGKL